MSCLVLLLEDGRIIDNDSEEGNRSIDNAVIALVDHLNSEALAVAHICIKVMMPLLVHDSRLAPAVVSSARPIPQIATKLIADCTNGCLESGSYLGSLVEACEKQDKLAVEMLPLVSEGGFPFSTEGPPFKIDESASTFQQASSLHLFPCIPWGSCPKTCTK